MITQPKIENVLSWIVPITIANAFDGISYNIYNDNFLRFFWQGSGATPWFRIEALAAGSMKFGYQLIKTGPIVAEEGAQVDPVSISTLYFFANNPAALPGEGFSTSSEGSASPWIRYVSGGITRNYQTINMHMGANGGGTVKPLLGTLLVYEGDNVVA